MKSISRVTEALSRGRITASMRALAVTALALAAKTQFCATTIYAQYPTPAPAGTQEKAASEKLNEWPQLKSGDPERVMAQIGQLRKADPATQAAAKQQLLGIGVAATPMLFGQVTGQANNHNELVFGVLDDLLDERHSALMVRECKKPKPELRRYLILRLCRFRETALLPVLLATQKDPDALTSFYASLGALALKEKSALPAVIQYTKIQWAGVGPLVAEILPAARCQEAGTWVFEAIAKAPAADQMAGLRIARYLAIPEQGLLLRSYLQGNDRAVVKEAVNTARVLHGEAPIENLDVFKSIEMAKEWLRKL
jgi:hypothetical protein